MIGSNTYRLPSPWGKRTLRSGERVTLELGPLAVWARTRGDEVWLAHRPGDWTRHRKDAAPTTDDRPRSPGDEDWVRWPVPDGSGELALSPVFPPRTVVVEPELSFRLVPGATARVYVRVPLWARVEAVGGETRRLSDLPSVVLSDTWWGSVTEGELCYWLRTTARREVRPEVFAPHVAVCPLQLSNRADEELPVEKIALRVAHLSLFSDEGRFWADETRVRYRGVEQGSDVDVSGRPPSEAPDAIRVTEPREAPPSRGLRTRTFARLRSLPGLGGV